MNSTHIASITAIISLHLLISCSKYREDPIDLSQELGDWKKQSNGAVTAASHTINHQQGRKIGLVMNAKLSQARLKLAGSQAIVKESGWWNDPSFSFDIKRILGSGVINTDETLGITLPVTGLPSLQKQIASLYQEVDYWGLCRKEFEFTEELTRKWSELSILSRKKALVEERIGSLTEEQSRIGQLVSLGEIDFSSRQIADQRKTEALQKQQMLAEQEQKLRMELLQMMGLHPSFLHSIRLVELPVDRIPESKTLPGEAQLVSTPGVRESMAKYAVSETELKKEIRKQYPELVLGPLANRDDGDDEIGLNMGFDIPLWNRNRQSIAVSSGNRAQARQEALSIWKEYLHLRGSLSEQQTLMSDFCRKAQTRQQDANANLKKQEHLYRLGETTLLTLSEARNQAYDYKLMFLDALGKLYAIHAQINALTISTTNN